MNTKDYDALVEGILEIGNHNKFIKAVEPNICFNQQLQAWMVRRVLGAYFLLMRENEKSLH